MDIPVSSVVVIAILILLGILILRKPLKLIFKFFLNTFFGFIALFVINYLGGFIGISIGINWITAAVTGILGLPGVALLLILQWLAII